MPYDAFNRLEVAHPFTEGDYPFTYGLQPRRFDAIPTGDATITHHATKRTAELKLVSVGDTAIFATRKYHIYQAGKGQKFVFSLTPGVKAGTRRRFGAFDNRNGIFFYIDENSKVFVVIRTDTSGSVVESAVEITDKLSWMDMTKNNLFFLDYQWLGAGIVDACCETSTGAKFSLHKFENPNKFNCPYMAYGSLPVRAEFESVTDTATVEGELMSITCLSAVSSGGSEPPQKQFEQSNGGLLSLTTTNETVVMGVRLAELIGTFENRSLAFPSSIDIGASDGSVRFRAYLFSSAPTGTWNSVSEDSMLEYSTDITKPVGGLKLMDRILISQAGTNNRTGITAGDLAGFTKTHMTRNHLNTDSDCLIITAIKINGGDTPIVTASLSGGETIS